MPHHAPAAHRLFSAWALMAEAGLIASLTLAWLAPPLLAGAASAVVVAALDRPLGLYSTTILGAEAARRASTASHLAQTRAAMAR